MGEKKESLFFFLLAPVTQSVVDFIIKAPSLRRISEEVFSAHAHVNHGNSPSSVKTEIFYIFIFRDNAHSSLSKLRKLLILVICK